MKATSAVSLARRVQQEAEEDRLVIDDTEAPPDAI